MPPLDANHFRRWLGASPDGALPSDASGRLLVVCMHFARTWHTGGVRWRAFARDLPRLGWHLDVLAADPAHAAERFPSDPPAFGAGVTQHLIPHHRWDERARLTARDAWWRLRDGLSSSDVDDPSEKAGPVDPGDAPVWTLGQRPGIAQRLKDDLVGAAELARDAVWTARAMRLARRLAGRHDYRAVIVTSPVHVTHAVGIGLARRGVSYVADFRDPLYYGRRDDLTRVDDVHRPVWQRLENGILRHARLAVDIAEGAQRAVLADLEARGLGSLRATPRHYIPNGYNALDAPERPDPDCFRVAYTGSLLPFMDVRVVLAACGRLRKRYGLGPECFRVSFMGVDSHFNGVPLKGLAEAYGLGAHFEQAGRRPTEEADALQQRAAVLVGFDSVITQGLCIPTKLYFYARTYGDLLLLGNPAGAMALEASKIGQPVLDPEDADAIDGVLDRAFGRWQRGAYDAPLDPDGLFDSRRSSIRMHNLLAGLGAPAAVPTAPASPRAVSA